MVTRAQMSGERGRLIDLPIPDGVRIEPYWCEFMRELGEIIGARNALRLVERIGGHIFNVPGTYPDDWIVSDVIGPANARLFHDHYAGWNDAHTRRIGCKVTVPTARRELERARLDPVIAAMQAGSMSLSDAAELTGLSIKRLSVLKGRVETASNTAAWSTQKPRDDRQITIFDVLEEAA